MSGYGPNEQSSEFQDSGVFNMSRNSQTSYGNVDNFAPAHHNPYYRQDGHHQQHHHHQHQHPRSNMPSHHHGHAGGGNSSGSGPVSYGGQPHHHHHHNHNHGVMIGMGSQQNGTVMMVYGLCPNRMNCDKLFNLFCLYGNVARIKFLKSKSGCAMVQMGDYMAVNRCMSQLNKVTIFNSEFLLSYSKQAFLHDVLQPYLLPDGSPSFKDFLGSKNNRFRNPEAANKNRILPPAPILHFFNAPYGTTVEELTHLIVRNCEHEPLQIKLFDPKNERSMSGLITFKTVSEATEALIQCNHIAIPRPGAAQVHILRLCFSSTHQKPALLN